MAAKDLYEKDLYQILGVKKSDDDAAIKKQYRKLARELHPDKTKGDKKLEERFKAVSEAYEVLSDTKKRADYDQMRELYKSGGVPSGGAGYGGGGANFQDVFQGQDLFSTLFGGGGRGPRRGADLQSETIISFRDSVHGKEITLRGEKGPITARIPAGISDGGKIKLKGRGQDGPAGPGDLFVIVHVSPHPLFDREGDNLKMVLPVTFSEAALGADIAVPTLDGEEVKVRLAPGTANGKTLRLKGRGVARNHHTGDLLVTIAVQIPQRLDPKAKQALEDFAAATQDENVRQDLAQRARA